MLTILIEGPSIGAPPTTQAAHLLLGKFFWRLSHQSTYEDSSQKTFGIYTTFHVNLSLPATTPLAGNVC
jgi:hypothetical protein